MTESKANIEPLETSNHTIYICITIDTELVLQSLPELRKGAATPANISHAHAHIIVTASGQVENQGTGDVALDIGAGDVVRFFTRSASNQFEHAVVLVSVRHARGDAILDRFELVTQERTGIAPASATSVLPARLVQQQFSFCECDVAGEGTATIGLVFAIHDRDEHGRPRPVGLYQWEPRLTFHLRSPSPKTTRKNPETAS